MKINTELTEEWFDKVVRVKCSLCNADIQIATIKEQMKQGYKCFTAPASGNFICCYCSEQLGLYEKV